MNLNVFLKETAIKSIQKYGVGSCGPRGFYGTIGKIFRELFVFFNILASIFYLIWSTFLKKKLN